MGWLSSHEPFETVLFALFFQSITIVLVGRARDPVDSFYQAVLCRVAVGFSVASPRAGRCGLSTATPHAVVCNGCSAVSTFYKCKSAGHKDCKRMKWDLVEQGEDFCDIGEYLFDGFEAEAWSCFKGSCVKDIASNRWNFISI